MSRRIEITRRELLLLVIGAIAIAVVMNWPLVLHLKTDIPKDTGDPLVQSWEVAWDGHALLHQPLHFFQSNQFWPLHDTLAFSDALLGYAPAGIFGSGPVDAVLRYNLLFLFAYALAFAGAYLLARELGLGPAASTVAGAAFAFAPLRLEHDGHMHVISSGGIPLALALGLRGYRLAKPGFVVAGFCVAAWQLSLGFTLGIPLTYLLATLGLIAAVVWWRRGRPPLPRRLVVATLIGGLIFGATALLTARPYLRVLDDQPNARRTPDLIQEYSGGPKAYLIAPDENTIWGDATAGIRNSVSHIPEKTLFPGLLTLVLAIVGVTSGVLPRGVRIGLGVGVLVVSALALGFQVKDGFLWPYRIAYDLFPGFQGIRTPGRLVSFSSLGLALLAGGGAEAARRRLTDQARGGRTTVALAASHARVAASLLFVLALAIAIEGRGLPFDPVGEQAQPPVPRTDIAFASLPAPQLHLPASPEDNRRYLLWSTDGFPKMINGRSSVDPVFTFSVFRRVRPFPDRATVRYLRKIGVRTVVLHTGRAAHTFWAHAAAKPVRGLPLTRTRRGYDVIYELSPTATGTGAAPPGAGASRRPR
ncbi:MAG: hypothetical protein QOD60_929 [Solirubrobacterales bacterium]|nr:hypothetical protein [Solirubrobacterales bacterium]